MFRIILASSSPRRIELMSQVGLEVDSLRPVADETVLRHESPRKMVARLAREKALSLAPADPETASPRSRTLIIGADTTVVAPDGKSIFGKPRNRKDATRMLRALAGKTHTVLTGYCILEISRKPKTHTRVVNSKVRMRPLSKQQIARYIDSGEPNDKAGAYAAQGLGMALIEGISGSYTNVVGLPMAQLLSDLDSIFGIALFGRSPK
ncbi:MAG: septum formation protein Maf [Bdellovibrionales bacterium RIFOXYC1_FULL_54_43]|nr:MAG: septum formation protein Maf [Bdellovibrionales bacterium RIFOXYC1_FULL_54_43]OFZ82271.1 MAG: septum formation protein Maf [Bdellovibrionales bacterium RIFOXYD1_FULL_55_31]